MRNTGAQVNLAAYRVHWQMESLRRAKTKSKAEWDISFNKNCKCDKCVAAEGDDDDDQLAKDLWDVMSKEIDGTDDVEDVMNENTDILDKFEAKQKANVAAKLDKDMPPADLDKISEAVQQHDPGSSNDPVHLCDESLLQLALLEDVANEGVDVAIPQAPKDRDNF